MLKLSKTAIRELSKMYRAVLMGAMVALIATGAQAADITITGGTMTDSATSTDYTVSPTDPLTGTVNIDLTDYSTTSEMNTAISTAEAAAKAYADGLASNYDAAGSADTALNNAKAYADSLASNYDAAGSADTALTDAKAYADSLASNYDAAGSANTALTDAKAYADGLLSSGSSNAKFDTLETTGNAVIEGDLVATDISATGDATVEGNLQTIGNATIGGNLNAGATTVGSLTTTGEAKLGTTTIVGTTTSAVVSGSTTITTREDLKVGSGLTVDTVTVTEGSTTISEKTNISINGDATVGGDLTTAGDASIGGTLNADSATITSSLEVGNYTTGGEIAVIGSTGNGVFLNGDDGGVGANYVSVKDVLAAGSNNEFFVQVDNSTGTSTSTVTNNGDIVNTGSITSGGLITANGGLTVKDGENLTLGGTAVNAIDTDGSNLTTFATASTPSTTLATVATVNSASAILSAGLQQTNNAVGGLNYSSTNYIKAGDNLTKAVSALDSNLYRLEEDVDEMNKEMKAGFASVAALSALQPNARAFNDTQISMGVGNYRGKTGFALGGFHYVNDNLMMNLGAAYAGDHSATFRGGLTFGW